MVLNAFAKDILDERYEDEGIEYIFDIETKRMFFKKDSDQKMVALGTISVDPNFGTLTFHKQEDPTGYLRKPKPSWGIHKHLVNVDIIKSVEYTAGNRIYRINTGTVKFLSCLSASYQGEPKYYVPISEWVVLNAVPKIDKSALQKTLEKKIHPSWIPLFMQEYQKEYLVKMLSYIKQVRNKGINVLPAQDNVFEALRLTGLEDVKVVILGQDPYPNREHPHGLAFSSKSRRTPASLRNVFTEIKRSYPHFEPKDNDLTLWALQGVLLLNSILTVSEGFPLSHKDLGWTNFTGQIIKEVSMKKEPVVWMLWGKTAQGLYDSLAYKNKHHLVLKSGHPSPMSVKLFENCGHFEKCNLHLRENQLKEINW